MLSQCTIHLMGVRLAADPELRQTDSAKSYTTATFLVNGGKDAQPTPFRVEAWDSNANYICKYKKGDAFNLIGYPVTNKYTDKEGVVQYATKVRLLATPSFLSSPQGSAPDSAPQAEIDLPE